MRSTASLSASVCAANMLASICLTLPSADACHHTIVLHHALHCRCICNIVAMHHLLPLHLLHLIHLLCLLNLCHAARRRCCGPIAVVGWGKTKSWLDTDDEAALFPDFSHHFRRPNQRMGPPLRRSASGASIMDNRIVRTRSWWGQAAGASPRN